MLLYTFKTEIIFFNNIQIVLQNQVTGDCQRYDSFDEDNFTQCGIFFRDVLNEEEKERLVDNIAVHIKDAQGFLQVKNNFHKSYNSQFSS